ncbi:MAG: MoaD/ThiS family protein [Pyrinomonadaceae bacterium]
MAITVYLSGHLKNFTGGETEVALDSNFNSVGDVLVSLCKLHPALRDRILNEQGEIRQHVNIFLGSDDVKRLEGLKTHINANEIHIFNAVSGG